MSQTKPSRFLQKDEDTYRLPEGMRRVAYDADTQVYTFQDKKGAFFYSAPGAQYGRLSSRHPMNTAPRPMAFDNGKSGLSSSPPASKSKFTYQNILPSSSITRAPPPVDPQQKQSGGFLASLRSTPTVKSAVKGLSGIRRSLTTRESSEGKDRRRSEKRGLERRSHEAPESRKWPTSADRSDYAKFDYEKYKD